MVPTSKDWKEVILSPWEVIRLDREW